MGEVVFKFRTPGPVTFRETGCDIVFRLEAAGTAYVKEYDAGKYGTGEEAVENLKNRVLELIPVCLAGWPEGEHVIAPDNCETLGRLLKELLFVDAITADIKVLKLDLDREQRELYQNNFATPPSGLLFERMFPQAPEVSPADDEIHGLLTGISYNRSTHGMMMGSGSYVSDAIEWRADSSVAVTHESNGGGKKTRSEYVTDPENAEKMREYVKKRRLAALSKMDIKTPVMYDCFTSSTIRMTFDDSSVGGSRYVTRTLQCGPAGMTFRTIEKEISDIIDECRQSGECVFNEMTEENNSSAGFFNVMSMFWTCSGCGYAKNTGKFCTECGKAR